MNAQKGRKSTESLKKERSPSRDESNLFHYYSIRNSQSSQKGYKGNRNSDFCSKKYSSYLQSGKLKHGV